MSSESHLSKEQAAAGLCDNEQHGSAAAAAAVLDKLMPGTHDSSSDDDEVAAINVGCDRQAQLIYGRQFTVAGKSVSSPDNTAGDINLELIEQN